MKHNKLFQLLAFAGLALTAASCGPKENGGNEIFPEAKRIMYQYDITSKNNNNIPAVAVSNDGRFVSGEWETDLYLWDLDEGTVEYSTGSTARGVSNYGQIFADGTTPAGDRFVGRRGVSYTVQGSYHNYFVPTITIDGKLYDLPHPDEDHFGRGIDPECFQGHLADRISYNGKVISGRQHDSFGMWHLCIWVFNEKTQEYEYKLLGDDIRETGKTLSGEPINVKWIDPNTTAGLSPNGRYVIGGFGYSVGMAPSVKLYVYDIKEGHGEVVESISAKGSAVSDFGEVFVGDQVYDITTGEKKSFSEWAWDTYAFVPESSFNVCTVSMNNRTLAGYVGGAGVFTSYAMYAYGQK